VAPVTPPASEEDILGPDSFYPALIGMQYTFILQHQSALHSPYAGPLSLKAGGDSQPTNTIGFYSGWAPLTWGQLYLDVEKFMGAGVSNATGLAAFSNGDVVPESPMLVRKQFYIARLYARFMLPLGSGVQSVDRAQDQIGGTEASRRLELKVGRLAVPDDFDRNRYANSARTEFLNWALINDAAWDYAADTRGYTDGVMLAYISPTWSLKYGVYRMPEVADGEPLVSSLSRASGQNLQFSYTGLPTGTVVRLLAYLNTASMGSYTQAIALAAATHTRPDIAASASPGRQKHGFALDAEQPLADDGATGLFLRWGWDDGKQESFVYTEADQTISVGVQISGEQWRQPGAQLGFGLVSDALSSTHRAYLAAGGCGFMLCDGRLNYGPEQVMEIYYRLERIWPEDPGPVRWEIGPDFQLIRNPGYNRDRGPARLWAIRLHVEY
jgi:high affinity Mn2+ porin